VHASQPATPGGGEGAGFVRDELVTRYVSFGSSPRGGQALILAAKVHALLAGRANVTAEDVERATLPALNHRLVLNFAAEADRIDPREIVARIVRSVQKLRR
jgi:MoxR-like ATPase